MRLRLAAPLVALSLFASPVLVTAASAVPQTQDGPVVTAREGGESVDALRAREAIAYETPLPRGAPTADYPLVAWCAALVEGHIALGRSLTTADDLDRDIMRLGGLEAADFRDALRAGAARMSTCVSALGLTVPCQPRQPAAELHAVSGREVERVEHLVGAVGAVGAVQYVRRGRCGECSTCGVAGVVSAASV